MLKTNLNSPGSILTSTQSRHAFHNKKNNWTTNPGPGRVSIAIWICVFVSVLACGVVAGKKPKPTICDPCPSVCKCTERHSKCELDCAQNGQTTLPKPSELPPLNIIYYVSVYTNPYTCDCELAWFSLWLWSRGGLTTVHHADKTTCSAPTQLKDRQLTSVTLQEYGCDPSKFASCLWPQDSSPEIIVVFSSFHIAAKDLTSCRQACFDAGAPYGLLAGPTSASTCLCGQAAAANSISCTESAGIEWETGSGAGSYIYIQGVWEVEAELITFQSIRPFSSKENTVVTVESEINFDSYSWSFSALNSDVDTDYGNVSVNVYCPGSSLVKSRGLSAGQTSSPAIFPLRVLDPVTMEIESDSDIIYADIGRDLDLKVKVHEGTDFSVSWSYTDENGKKGQELFCPGGWLYTSKRCVGRRLDGAATYRAATKACTDHGGQLLEVRGRWEIRRILGWLGLDTTQSPVHLGAQQSADSFTYTWASDGRETYFTAANVTGPTRGSCVTTTGDGSLEGALCDEQQLSVCQQTPLQCASEGVYDPDLGVCYLVVKDTVTYGDAVAACEGMSGQVIEVTSEKRARFIVDNVFSHSSDQYWIGLTDLDSEGHFLWPSGLSLGNYAPWSAATPQTHHCVAMAMDVNQEMYWERRDCDNPPTMSVCQLTPSKKLHSVPVNLAGLPGAVPAGPSTNLSHHTPGPSPVPIQTTLHILPGSFFTESGTLQSWLFEVAPLTGSSQTLQLMVLRPVCPTPYNLLHPDCPGATYPFSICTTSVQACTPTSLACRPGYQSCPLTRSCIKVEKPCTCSVYGNTTACVNEALTARKRKKRSVDFGRTKRSVVMETYPEYQVVGMTTTLLSDPGIARVDAEAMDIQAFDVIGYQYSGIDRPIKCSGVDHTDWQQGMLISNSLQGFMSPLDLQNVTSFTFQDVACGIIGKYTKPEILSPSAPYKDRSNFSLGEYNFTVSARNAISSGTTVATVRFQKKLKGFTVVVDENIYRPEQNVTIVYVETGTNNTFLLGITQGTDAHLQIIWPTDEGDATFTPTCPTNFTTECQVHFKSTQAEFTTVQVDGGTSPFDLPVTFVAANQISEMEIKLLLRHQDRITGITASNNVTYAVLGEPIKWEMKIAAGSDEEYTWIFSGVETYTGASALHSFPATGFQLIVGKACNKINCEEIVTNVTVIEPGSYGDIQVVTPSGVYVGDDALLNFTIHSNAWTIAKIICDYGDGSNEEEIDFQSGSNTVNHLSTLHKYAKSGYFTISLTVKDIVSAASKSATGKVNVCDKVSGLTISASTFIALNSTATFSLSSPTLLSDMTYYWIFGDGSPEEKTLVSTNTHKFSTTGEFLVKAMVSTCVGRVAVNCSITVEEPITGLQIESDRVFLVNHPAFITVVMGTGSLATLTVDWKVSKYVQPNAGQRESAVITYTQIANYNVTVSLANNVGKVTSWILLYVIEDSAFDVVDIIMSPCAALGEPVAMKALVLHKDPAALLYAWNYGTGNGVIKDAQQTSTVYPSSGTYPVTVRISDSFKTASFSKDICIEQTLAGLAVSAPSDLFLPLNGSVTLKLQADATDGVPVGYVWTFDGSADVETPGNSYVWFIHKGGVYHITVGAWNHVSSVKESVTVTVYQEITGLFLSGTNSSLVNNIHVMRVGMNYHFTASIASGTGVEFHWSFGTFQWTGSNVTVNFNDSQTLTVELMASNAMNKTTVTFDVNVEEPIEGVTIKPTTDLVLANVQSEFIVEAHQGSHMVYSYHICSSQSCRTTTKDKSSLKKTFQITGEHSINLTIVNDISEASSILEFFVYPELQILIQNETDVEYVEEGQDVKIGTEWTQELTGIPYSTLRYDWLITDSKSQSIKSSTNEFFVFSPAAEGEYVIKLKVVLNTLETTLEKKLTIVRDIGNVKITTDIIESRFVIKNNDYNFTAEETIGTGLTYHWKITSPLLNFNMSGKTITCNFNVTGVINVSVEVSNAAGKTKGASLQVESQSDLSDAKIANNHSLDAQFVCLGQPVAFYIIPLDLWPVRTKWHFFEDPNNLISSGTEEIFVIELKKAQTYIVNATVTNNVSSNSLSLELLFEDCIEDLQINPSDVVVSIGELQNFTASVKAGSNVAYNWSIDDTTVVASGPFLSYNFTEGGQHHVQVTASNKVSFVTAEAVAYVKEYIFGLEIIDPCEDACKTKELMIFRARVSILSSTVTYNWTLQDGSDHKTAEGPIFSHIFLKPSLYILSVTATNTITLHSETIRKFSKVQDEIESVYLRVLEDTFGFFILETVQFQAIVNVVTNASNRDVSYRWNIYNTNIIYTEVTDIGELSYMFDTPSLYVVTVIASNDVSSVSDTKLVVVNSLDCAPPVVQIVGSTHRFRQRSGSVIIESYVESCNRQEIKHKWRVYNVSCSERTFHSADIQLPDIVSVDAPILRIPGRTLNTGVYCLRIVANYLGHFESDSAEVTLSIIPTPLMAVIRGGNEVTVARNIRFTLDGTLSYDPDLADSEENAAFSYLWTCSLMLANGSQVNASECFQPQTSPVVTVESYTFMDGRQYIIDLVIWEHGRTSGRATQKIIASRDNIPMPSIDCVSCREINTFAVSQSYVIKLLGKCLNCDDNIKIQWSVRHQNGQQIVLDNSTTKTGASNNNLVLRRGVLMDKSSYDFLLNISSPVTGLWGYAKMTLNPSSPPSNGTCISLHSHIVTALDDIVYVECRGWVDHSGTDSPLSYLIYVTNSAGEWYPVYHGTKSLVTFMLSPFESSQEQVHLVVYVVDQLGIRTVALNETLYIISYPSMDYLIVQVTDKLPIIQRSDDPKLILGFIITILLNLNQVSSRDGTEEHPHHGAEHTQLEMDEEFLQRMMLRSTLFEVLQESCRIVKMDDIQQTAFALNLLTKHPQEIPRINSTTTIIIDLMENMISFMMTVASQGLDSDDFVPHYNLATISNSVEAIKIAMMTEQLLNRPISPELEDSMQKMFLLGRRLTYLTLSTQVPDEEAYSHYLGLFQFTGKRVIASKIQQDFTASDYHVHFPRDLLSHLPPQTELFQTMETATKNPLIWGFGDGFVVTSHVISVTFGFSNFSTVPIKHLPESKEITISIARSPFYSDGLWTDMKSFLGKYLEASINKSITGRVGVEETSLTPKYISFSLAAQQSLSTVLNTTYDLENGGSVGIKMMVEGLHSAGIHHNSEAPVVHLFVGVNYVPHRYMNDYTLNVTMETDMNKTSYNASLVLSHEHMLNKDTLHITVTNDDPLSAWNVSITTFLSLCKYFETAGSQWSSKGCYPSNESDESWTICKCNHMTSFGSSVYFSDNVPEFQDLLELDFRSNPVVISTVCCLAAVVVVAMVLASHWDRLDVRRMSKVPLCGRSGPYKYEVTLMTGRSRGAGTSAHVGLRIYGTETKSRNFHLLRPGAFSRASCDIMMVATETLLGDMYKIHVWHDNSGRHPSWYLCRVIIRDVQTNKKYHFLVDSWMSLTHEECVIDRYVNVAPPDELHSFRSLFHLGSTLGFSDHHVFVSVVDAPPYTSFSRVQRVTICATYLYTYIFANAAWFGLIRQPSEYERLTGDSPLEWGDVFVGLMASLTVMPVVILLTAMFRLAKVRARAVGQTVGRPSTAQTVEMDAMISLSSRGSSAVSRRMGALSLEDIEGKNSGKSVIPAGRLRRTAPLRLDREASLELSSSDSSSLQSGTSNHPSREAHGTWWSHDGILAWPEHLPEVGGGSEGGDSRQSSASSSHARFLRRNTSWGGSSKRKFSITGSEMMELEEIEEVDDFWEDESPRQQDKAEETVAKETAEKKPAKEKCFTPRTEADIDDLIKEMDAAIDFDGKPKRKTSDTHSMVSSNVPSHLETSCNNITIECAACMQQKSAKRHDPTLKHLDDCRLSRETSNCSNNSSNVGPKTFARRKDSLNRYSSLRRPSFSQVDQDAIRMSLQPLQPSEDLTAATQNPENMWAWSRSTTWIEAPHFISLGPRSDAARCRLPFWCRYVAYLLCVGLVCVSVICVLVYGHRFGRDLSIRWLLACFFSIVLSAFVLEPLKVVLIALFTAGVHRSADVDVYKPGIQPVLENNEKIKDDIKIRPIGGFALLRAKTEGQRVSRMHDLLRSGVLYTCLLLVALLTCYMYHTNTAYRLTEHTDKVLLNRHLNSSMASLKAGQLQLAGLERSEPQPQINEMLNFYDVTSSEEMWLWLDNVALPWLHQYDTTLPVDGATLKLLGRARLRQIRSKLVTCPAHKTLADYLLVNGCYGDGAEDHGSYGVGWNKSSALNHTWTFMTKNQHSPLYFGNVSHYPGGGYVQDLGLSVHESASVTDDLRRQGWVDRGTRAIILEFTQYNPNVDLYLIGKIAFEYPTSGGVFVSRQLHSTRLLRYKSNIIDPIMIIQFFLFGLTIWLIAHIVQQLRSDWRSYVQSGWSWAELVVGVACVVSLCLYVRNVVTNTRLLSEYFSDREEYVELAREAYLVYVWEVVNAVMLFTLTVMVSRQLRFIRCLSVFVEALSVATWRILGCALLFVIALCVHLFTGCLWFGTEVYAFRSLTASLGSILTIYRGNSPFFPAMTLFSPHFTTLFVLTLAAMLFVVVFGLLLAVISDAYHSVRSQQTYLSSMDTKDHEMVNFMMKRFKMMIGVKKPKPAFRRVKFQGLPTLSSASSRSTRASSSTQSQGHSESTTSSDFSDLSDFDVEMLLDHAESTWDRLLRGMDELEDSEEEEKNFDRHVVKMISAIPENKHGESSKGKTLIKGDSKPKNTTLTSLTSEGDDDEAKRTERKDAEIQKPVISTEEPHHRGNNQPAISRSISASVGVRPLQLHLMTPRAVRSADRSVRQLLPNTTDLPVTPRMENGWTDPALE